MKKLILISLMALIVFASCELAPGNAGCTVTFVFDGVSTEKAVDPGTEIRLFHEESDDWFIDGVTDENGKTYENGATVTVTSSKVFTWKLTEKLRMHVWKDGHEHVDVIRFNEKYEIPDPGMRGYKVDITWKGQRWWVGKSEHMICDHDFVYTFTPLKAYTITMDMYGTPEEHIYYDGEYVQLKEVEREGYRFTGIRDGNGEGYPIGCNVLVEGDMSFTYHWEKIIPEYTVTVIDGESRIEHKIKEGGTFTPEHTRKPGEMLVSVKDQNGKEYPTGMPFDVTEDVTLTYERTPSDKALIKITASGSKDVIYTYADIGSDFIPESKAEKEGYGIYGYDCLGMGMTVLAGEPVKIVGDVEFQAFWRKMCTVTWVNRDGKDTVLIEKVFTDKGIPVEKKEVPKQKLISIKNSKGNDYIWSSHIKFMGDETVTYEWHDLYDIKVLGLSSEKVLTAEEGVPFVLPSETVEGKMLSHIKVGEQSLQPGESFTFTSDSTIEYVWKAKCTISFSGVERESEIVDSGTVWTVPDLSKKGWWLESVLINGEPTEAGRTHTIDSDTVITAKLHEPAPLSDFTYTVDPYGELIISGYTGNAAIVVVPIKEDLYHKSVTVAEGTFKDNDTVEAIAFTDGINRLEFKAVENCIKLKRIVIPPSLTGCGSGAFWRLPNVTKVIVDDRNGYLSVNGNSLIGGNDTLVAAFNNSIIPSTVTRIGRYAFSPVEGVGELILHDNVVTFDFFAFGSADIRKITISNWMPGEENGNYAFRGSSVEEVILPPVLDRIPDYFFDGCTNLKEITLPQGITGIGRSAFARCTSLESIGIPSDVSRIGDAAFSGCTKLSRVTIGEKPSLEYIGNSAFQDCSALGSLELPEKLETIGNDAFQSSGIASAHLPSGIKSIGNYAFRECRNLKSVYVPASLTTIGEGAFMHIASKPDFLVEYGIDNDALGMWWTPEDAVVTKGYLPDLDALVYDKTDGSIGIRSFFSHEPALSIPRDILGKKVTEIAESAFLGDETLVSIFIPDTISSIGNGAFSGCTKLESVDGGIGVTRIGSYAFSGCTAMSGPWLPGYVEEVGAGAFKGHSAEKVTIPLTLVRIGSGAFMTDHEMSIELTDGVKKVPADAFKGLTALKAVYIPSSVNEIGSDAFSGCTALTTINGAGNVETIGDRAFMGCSSLPDASFIGLKTIGVESFSGCTSLSSFHVPEGMMSVGDRAFKDCTGMDEIWLVRNISTFGHDVFEGWTMDQTVFVKKGSTLTWDNIGKNIRLVMNMEPGAEWGWNKNYAETYVTGYYGKGGDVVVPETFGGSPLDGFNSRAFQGAKGPITSISIGSSSLMNVIADAFFGLPDFKLIIREGTKNSPIFHDAPNVTELELPSTLSKLWKDSFTGLTGLRNLTIPKGVNVIEGGFFKGAKLDTLTLESGNTVYGMDGNCIMTEDPTNGYTVVWGWNRDSVIPENAAAIGSSAFEGTLAAETLTVPGKVIRIGERAFADMKGVKAIYIPKSVRFVNAGAFSGLDSTVTIYIQTGTDRTYWSKDWNKGSGAEVMSW